MGVPYTSTPTSLTVVVNFRPTVIPSSHPNFAELLRLVKLPDTTERDIVPLLDVPTAISNYTGGEITVLNGRLFYRGSAVKNNLATIILGFVKSGDPTAAEPFKKFLANCRQNPDLALVDTIYDWCVKSNLPITPDGEILAWKSVRTDYLSSHSGKRGRLRHQVGDVVTEPREECDPNRNQTCSTGIHFCSMEYLPHFGLGNAANRIMAVVINPADITAIPTDYNLAKGRCCKLRVVGEVENRREVIDGFYGTAKVYSGWTPASTPTPRTSGGIAVGQVWLTRAGKEQTIKTITGAGSYVVGDNRGNVYTASGRYNSDTSVSQFDLVRLVKDVA